MLSQDGARMSEEFIKRAKLRLAYLAIGLFLGLFVSAVVGGAYHQVMKIRESAFEERIEHLRTLSEIRLKETKRLLVENEKLKTTRIERKNADGSSEVIEKTSSDSSKSEQESSRDIAMLEHTIKTLREEHKQEIEIEKKKRPSLTAHMGLTSQLVPYAAFTYNVYGMAIIGGYVDKSAEFGIGAGIQF